MLGEEGEPSGDLTSLPCTPKERALTSSLTKYMTSLQPKCASQAPPGATHARGGRNGTGLSAARNTPPLTRKMGHRQNHGDERMERSSASVGLGIPRCRSVFREGARGRGGSFLNGFPSGEVTPKSVRGKFPVVGRPLVVASSCEMVFTSPCGPQFGSI
jgi:hypothetical protein